MNDLGLDGDVSAVAATSAPMLAATMLKEAREAQGLHIAALAVALKVPVKKLEALEAGRFDQLPDMVFARSLALSVCRALKVDPVPIMASLPEAQYNQFKVSEAGLNTTFKDSPGTSHRGFLAQLSSPIGLGVAVLIVAIAVILVWPVSPLFEEEFDASTEPSIPAAAVEPVPQPPQISASNGDAVAVSSASSLLDQPPLPVVAGVPMLASNVASVATPASVANTEVAAASSLLELSGHGESWVEVTDSTGQSRLRKLIQNGEVIRVTGQLPLSVTVGRADKVTVAVRGTPLDLIPLARENVARFEVK